MRFAAVLLVSVLYAEAPLQQPPRDGRRPLPSATQLSREAHELYREGRWADAAEKYEAGLAAQPDWVAAHFYLANCYDRLYSPSQAGEGANDSYLQRAIQHYEIAAERDTDLKMRKLAMEYLVAAYGPQKLNDPQRAVPLVERMIQMDPADPINYVALAKLYEDEGRYDDAEAALTQAIHADPRNVKYRKELAGLYNRMGDFPKTMQVLEEVAELDSRNPESYQLLATYYWEKAQKDHRQSPEQKRENVEKGLEATDKALAINPDYVEALTYKNILLRMKALDTADVVARDALVAEADALRARAMELNRLRGRGRGGA